MFVSRRQDGTIYGMWAVRQFDGQEELPDNHPEVVAGPVPLPQTQAELDLAARMAIDATETAAVKQEGQVQTFLNMTEAQFENWIANNITAPAITLAQLKANTGTALTVLGKMARAAGRGRILR